MSLRMFMFMFIVLPLRANDLNPSLQGVRLLTPNLRFP